MKKPYTDYVNWLFSRYFANPHWYTDLQADDRIKDTVTVRTNASHKSDPTCAAALSHIDFTARHVTEQADYIATVQALQHIAIQDTGAVKLDLLRSVYGGTYKTVTAAIISTAITAHLSQDTAWKYLNECCKVLAIERGLTAHNCNRT